MLKGISQGEHHAPDKALNGEHWCSEVTMQHVSWLPCQEILF